MLNIGQLIFPLKKGQNLSSKVEERLQHYGISESTLFGRYSSLQNIISSSVDDIPHGDEDGSSGFRYFITILEKALSESYEINNNGTLICDEVIHLCETYIARLSASNNSYGLQHISDTLDVVKSKFTRHDKYSLFNAAKLLKKKDVTTKDRIEIIRNIYFARDYLNIQRVKEIRSYIMQHPSIPFSPDQSLWKANPGNTFMGLIFSDMPIFSEALMFSNMAMNNIHITGLDHPIDTEDDEAVENFNLVLLLGYYRYLIGGFIFLIQSDYSGFFDNRGVEKWLLNAYRQCEFGILTAIYTSFTTVDMVHAVSMIFLDDICTYTAANFTLNRLDDARAMASALSRDVAIKDFSEIIEKICNSAVEQWEAGSNLDHISMLETFKKDRRYAKYFEERGFEWKLKSKLREIMRAKGLRFILGEDVFKRTDNKN